MTNLVATDKTNQTIHLICNAHIDPVWLWKLEEGRCEAISTFRTAVNFCEEFEGFVFNHNEALLYQWIEEYEPELFKRILKLVNEGKWHIMGGWYLQPDCNMPSGESFVRQILIGKKYFEKKFKARPSTAINFDPFGHTRGLVQILAKSGYDSYLFTRPREANLKLPIDFIWLGHDGSMVKAHRAFEGYQTHVTGWAAGKIERWMRKNEGKSPGLVLWGIGDHGGGPSKLDLVQVNEMIRSTKEYTIINSKPENYFKDIENGKLPVYERDLNPWAPGCYTSQIRIKSRHRKLENELFMVEKMVSCACMQGLMDYPAEEFNQVMHDLALSQFHDVLAGTSIQSVEEWALQLMDHGLEILSGLKFKAFYKMASLQERPKDGEFPVFIYNPHPYRVKGIFKCEISPPEARRDKTFYDILSVKREGLAIPYQIEKEESNLSVDWRKLVVFEADLEPSSVNRFDCRLEVVSEKPYRENIDSSNGYFIIKTDYIVVKINRRTGLLDKYCVNGYDYIKDNTFLPLVITDDEDSWGAQAREFRDVAGSFILASGEESAVFSGVRKDILEPVRVIEDGRVRTVIEAILKYNLSYLCIHYIIPKKGTEIEINIRIYWNEKNRMLKLSVPVALKQPTCKGQTAFGINDLLSDGSECVSQKWSGVFSAFDSKALTLINSGTYGLDFKNGEMRISLIRSPGYAALQNPAKTTIPQDRFSHRIDQGERTFKFWLNAGEYEHRLSNVERESQWHNEAPMVLSFFSSGSGNTLRSVMIISGEKVILSALKRSEDKSGYIIRLYNPSETDTDIVLKLDALGIESEIHFSKYEIKTFKTILSRGIKGDMAKLQEVNLIEDKT